MNQDGGWNVLDIVTLANCVLNNTCGQSADCCWDSCEDEDGYGYIDACGYCCDIGGSGVPGCISNPDICLGGSRMKKGGRVTTNNKSRFSGRTQNNPKGKFKK